MDDGYGDHRRAHVGCEVTRFGGSGNGRLNGFSSRLGCLKSWKVWGTVSIRYKSLGRILGTSQASSVNIDSETRNTRAVVD